MNLANAPTLDAVRAEMARRSLREFVRQAWHVVEPGRPYIPNWHIDAICEHLEAVSKRQVRKLIINMPPRHMKSLLVSVFWPTWVWITNPEHRWLFASYAQTLSIRDSVKCRRLIESPWYQKRFGDRYQLTGDQNSKVRFDNDRMGYRLATSVGGALTGEGGDTIGIDDPHNVVDGESDAMRAATLEWWDQAMSTRLNDPKTGAYVIVMQRVHGKDLCGHILERSSGWDHLMLPARFESAHPTPTRSSIGFVDPRTEDRELLWPERVGESELRDLEQSLGSYGAAGQLQQRPSPAGGGLFKREWFRYFTDEQGYYTAHKPDGTARRVLKADCWRFVTCDLAISTKTYNDYSVIQVWDVERVKTNGEVAMFLVEQWRERKEAPYVEDELRNTLIRWSPSFIGVEDNSNFDTSVIQRFRRDGLPVRPIKPDRDKVTRATMASVWMEGGKIHFPLNAPWLGELERELMVFPHGEHDDSVDCIAYAAIFANNRDLWTEPPKSKFAKGTLGAIAGHGFDEPSKAEKEAARW